jgi:hypothetical protein
MEHAAGFGLVPTALNADFIKHQPIQWITEPVGAFGPIIC